jgi:hypothetical protein
MICKCGHDAKEHLNSFGCNSRFYCKCKLSADQVHLASLRAQLAEAREIIAGLDKWNDEDNSYPHTIDDVCEWASAYLAKYPASSEEA